MPLEHLLISIEKPYLLYRSHGNLVCDVFFDEPGEFHERLSTPLDLLPSSEEADLLTSVTKNYSRLIRKSLSSVRLIYSIFQFCVSTMSFHESILLSLELNRPASWRSKMPYSVSKSAFSAARTSLMLGISKLMIDLSTRF